MGVPVIAPVLLSRLSPVGSVPATDQVGVPVPPLLATVWEYPEPTTPLGNEFVVIVNGGAIVIENPLVVVAPTPSVTLMVKLGVPAVDGVPESTPLVARLNPAGSGPAETDQVAVPVPPDEARVVVYPAPAVAAGNELVVTESAPLMVIESD